MTRDRILAYVLIGALACWICGSLLQLCLYGVVTEPPRF